MSTKNEIILLFPKLKTLDLGENPYLKCICPSLLHLINLQYLSLDCCIKLCEVKLLFVFFGVFLLLLLLLWFVLIWQNANYFYSPWSSWNSFCIWRYFIVIYRLSIIIHLWIKGNNVPPSNSNTSLLPQNSFRCFSWLPYFSVHITYTDYRPDTIITTLW